MPLHPKRQKELDDVGREISDMLERGGPAASERTRPALLQVGRHLVGLLGALKQLDAGMEDKVKAVLASRLSPTAEPKQGSLELPDAAESKVE